MAPLSISCPHCHSSYSGSEITGALKCLTCGAPLSVPDATSDTERASPDGKLPDASTDSQMADIGTFAGSLTFLSPAKGPNELGWLGPYRVLEQLGSGGMGIVLKAEDPGLRRLLALKVMRPEYAVDPAARARFLREARASAAVEHEHIVPIFQIAEARGTAFLAMPLLRGESLSTCFKRSGVLTLSESVRICRETAEGLAAAHAAGLIHRDIKPGNIWLEGKRRRVRILDFGLARVTSESGIGDQTLTREGAVIGTPAYMSPEQARGFKVDNRSDLFSLGVVLYQMVTGHLPFRGMNSTAVLMAIVMEEPQPPAALNPSVSPALNDLILALLQKSPAGRPSSADKVVQRLAELEGGHSSVPVAEAAESTTDAGLAVFSNLDANSMMVESVRVEPRQRAKPARGRRRVSPALYVSALGGVVVLLGASVIAWQLFGNPDRGTLVIDSEDATAEVIVRRDGAVVQERTRNREIRLRSGEYSVELAERKAGVRIGPERVAIPRGGRETVWISLAPKATVPTTPTKKKESKGSQPDPKSAAPLVFNGPTPPGGSLPAVPREANLPPWELPKGITAALHPFTASEAKELQDIWAKHLAKPVAIDNKLGMSFALIPPGEFDFAFTAPGQAQATPETRSLRVRLSRPFYFGTTEVTFGQFDAFVKATGYKTDAETSGEGGWSPEKGFDPKLSWRKPTAIDKVDPRHPVAQVSWHDAMAFCEWLGKQDGVTYRLPTEAEWRFAARAGSKLKYGPADTAEDFRYHEWTADDKLEIGQPPYRPVGVKRANAFGLYDMIGNVNEWALDCTPPEYARYLQSVDPLGATLRASNMGAHFALAAADASPEYRWWSDSRTFGGHATGFRIVREVSTPGETTPGLRVRPGQALSSRATVTQPGRIVGLQSWTVETAGALGGVVGVAWSKVGNRIATVHQEDATVRLWDRTGNLVGVLLGHESPVWSVSFSHDGKSLATWGEAIRIWDVPTGACRAVLSATYNGSNRVSLSPDGSLVLCYGQTLSGVFEVATGRRLSPTAQTFAYAEWSPDGKQILVSSSAANTAPAVWSVRPYEKIADLKVNRKGKDEIPTASWGVGWSPDGKWVAVGSLTDPPVVHVWDAKTYGLKSSVPATAGVSLAWHPDSRRLAIVGNGIWDALEAKKLVDLTGDNGPFAWAPDGSEAISGSLFRAAATGQGLQSLSIRGQTTAGPLSLSLDGKRMIDTSKRPGRLRDAETGEVLKEHLELLPGSLTSWSPVGDQVAVWGPANVPVRLIDPESGELKVELKDAVNVNRLTWSPDGKRIATAVGKDISVWDTSSGMLAHSLPGHTAAVAAMIWSPDGSKFATAGQDITVRVWDGVSGKLLSTILELPEPGVAFSGGQGLAWSPDGQTLWVAKANTYPLNVRTGQFGPGELLYYGAAPWSLSMARDGTMIAYDRTDWIALRAGEPPVRTLVGPGFGVGVNPVWLPDSRRFVTGTPRGHIAYDTFSRSRIGTFYPIVGAGEHWLLIGQTGHYRATPGIESHLVYVAMHDDGSQRTYTPADFAAKFGWKNDPTRATFTKLDPEAAKIKTPPSEGYWPRLAAMQSKGGKFWRADGTEVKVAADLTPGTVLGKIAFQSTASDTPLADGDVEALRNLPILEGVLRLEGAGLTDEGLARLLGFAVVEGVSVLEIVDTPAGDTAVAAAASLRALTRLSLTGTKITDATLPSLKVAKKLEMLDLRKTKLTEPAVKALAAALPSCRIEWDGGAIEPSKK